MKYNKPRIYSDEICLSCTHREGDPIYADCSVCRRDESGNLSRYEPAETTPAAPNPTPGLRPYTDEDFKRRRFDVLMHYNLEHLAEFIGTSFNDQYVLLFHTDKPMMSINDWVKWLSEEAESWDLPSAHN